MARFLNGENADGADAADRRCDGYSGIRVFVPYSWTAPDTALRRLAELAQQRLGLGLLALHAQAAEEVESF